MIEKKQITQILSKAPTSPGVYQMYNDKDEIIYIGKAKDLKSRLKQYFQKNYQHSSRTKKLLEKMSKITYTATDSELEAVILESTLIKKHQPKYNVIMKDDKSFVYIRITREDFPRIQIVRKIEKDGSKYIGPKSAAHKVKETLKVLKKIFPFRHCSLDIDFISEQEPKNKVKVTNKTIKYPCLDYFIKRCIAPCIGCCNKEQYAEIIKNVEDFLGGKADSVLKDLNTKMQQAALEKKFEKAAKIRDKIKKVEDILEKQKVSDPNQENKDVINYVVSHDKAFFNLFQIRDGKLINQENFTLNAHEIHEADSEVLESFLQQYYELATDIPKEILVPHTTENQDILSEIIKARFIVPQRGTKNRLLEMSLKNASIYADRQKPSWQTVSQNTVDATKELQKILKLKNELKRIECYDISHLSGTETVGSMVVFEKGAPKKDQYRKFRIRTLIHGQIDDYKSMEEVLKRRLSKIGESINQKDYLFKKARKKDHDFIEKNNSIELSKTDRTFYILEHKKKPIGFIATKEHSAQVAEISNLWLTKQNRGAKLGYKPIKEAIKKTKAKRIYIFCKKELKDYYLLAGFEEIKKIPEELCEREKECKKRHNNQTVALAYDKYKHKPDKSFEAIPDLLVIDGGKGQLAVANKVLTELNLSIPHISLAKRLEEIFTPHSKNSILLPENNEALKLLQRSRDEAHRFAITYNKDLRSKKFKKK